MFSSNTRRLIPRLRNLLAGSIVLISWQAAQGQQGDTLVLDIPAAERIFLQKNLQLLAAQYNVDANRALIEQARLWDNPVLSTDQNIYDGKFFRHDADNGQIFIQIQQLVRTAGKRTKLAKLASDNTRIAWLQFRELMRTLRSTLINDMIETSHLLTLKKLYESEEKEVTKLVTGIDGQSKAGNISTRDLTRLEALLFGIQNEVAVVESQLLPLQQELKLLLQASDSSFIKPSYREPLAALSAALLPPASILIDTARLYRPDAGIDLASLDYAYHNVSYQKALAKPDLSLGLAYDQRSSYQPNYVGFQLGLPIPVLNRNQGNIKAASFQVKMQEAALAQTGDRIANEVRGAREKVVFYQQLNSRQQMDFSNQYDSLFQNMVTNFRDRQMDLLELIDFIDNYKDTKLQVLQQRLALAQAIADLNYTVNRDVVPLQ